MNEYLRDMNDLIYICVKRKIKLDPLKCNLYRIKKYWCGRELSIEGVHYDPRQVENIEEIGQTETPIQLLHFTSTLHWMRKGITQFATLILLLRNAQGRA